MAYISSIKLIGSYKGLVKLLYFIRYIIIGFPRRYILDKTVEGFIKVLYIS